MNPIIQKIISSTEKNEAEYQEFMKGRSVLTGIIIGAISWIVLALILLGVITSIQYYLN